jgi:hypothetical protein
MDTSPTGEGDGDAPPGSPAESLRLIADQQAVARRGLTVDPLVYNLPWGLAWLIGFGLLFLRFGPRGRVIVDMPAWLPLTAMFVAMGIAAVVTTVVPVRVGRHVSGPSAVQGAMYGWAWFATFSAIGGSARLFAQQLPADQARLLWSWLCVLAAGVLLICGAAVFRQVSMFVFGLCVVALDVVGAFAGPGWHSLIIAVGGGGGMIALGVLGSWRHRRPG